MKNPNTPQCPYAGDRKCSAQNATAEILQHLERLERAMEIKKEQKDLKSALAAHLSGKKALN